jgi:hypothetical protein
MFVDELLKREWTKIDPHHFKEQTSEAFDDNIFHSKRIDLYDISSIDYTYIESLYQTKIPESILLHKEGHERRLFNERLEKYVYDLEMNDYYQYDIDYNYVCQLMMLFALPFA